VQLGLGHFIAKGLKIQHLLLQEIDQDDSLARLVGRGRVRRLTHFTPHLLRALVQDMVTRIHDNFYGVYGIGAP
jgi:hypothetical protein